MPVARVVQCVIGAQADAAPRAADDLLAVLDAGACVLVAADVLHALDGPQPHRPAREPAAAAAMATATVAGGGGVARRVSFPYVLGAWGRPGVG
jgi:hypothetical protein